jgi:tetratricopeptide (TPR) repeat protein
VDSRQATLLFSRARLVRSSGNTFNHCRHAGILPRRACKRSTWGTSILPGAPACSLGKAAALDPKNATILVNLALSYMALRNFEAAEKTSDRAIAAAPQAFAPVGLKAYLIVASRGDLTGAEKQITSIPVESDPNGVVAWARWWLLMLNASSQKRSRSWKNFLAKILSVETSAPVPKALLKGIIHWLQGDKLIRQF